MQLICINNEDLRVEPDLFRVSEAWESHEAPWVRFEAPHMDDWRREREALGMADRRVVACAVSGEEAL